MRSAERDHFKLAEQNIVVICKMLAIIIYSGIHIICPVRYPRSMTLQFFPMKIPQEYNNLITFQGFIELHSSETHYSSKYSILKGRLC